MNLYFLVEGSTEKYIYPLWISHLMPQFTRVKAACEAIHDHYFIWNGGGYPHLLDENLANSINEVDDCGTYDYLILCLDCDEKSPQETIAEVEEFIGKNKLSIKSNCQLKIIPQYKTIETWCLGNKKVFPRHNLSLDFRRFTEFYNVSIDDPELMSQPNDFIGSVGDYHYSYLSTMLREKNMTYTKSKHVPVTELSYLQQLKKRTQTTSHLATLKYFFDFCTHISHIQLAHSK